MGIYGVGLDLVRVDRLQRLLDRFGARFEHRVFTPVELEACSKKKTRAACLAMRFSAKEAFTKALGTGLRAPVLWQDVEVRSNPLGKPEIFLSERAAQFCEERGVRSWHLSLTDDGDYGAAVVILES